MPPGGEGDEAELRGHRRTYIGALPGRILAALKKAKVRNPVLLLDEIDKLGNGWRGSPEAAIIRYYPRESGVRQLIREISKICRAAALEVTRTADGKPRMEVDEADLPTYLGKLRFYPEIAGDGEDALEAWGLHISETAPASSTQPANRP